MPELQVIARYTVSAGHQDEVASLVAALAAASRAEPGCLAFTGHRDLDDDRRIVLLERYASADAFAAHRDSAHFTELVLGRIVPLLDSRVVEIYEAPATP